MDVIFECMTSFLFTAFAESKEIKPGVKTAVTAAFLAAITVFSAFLFYVGLQSKNTGCLMLGGALLVAFGGFGAAWLLRKHKRRWESSTAK